jgi:N-acetylglucosamine kinase-like BadF-type ATPase
VKDMRESQAEIIRVSGPEADTAQKELKLSRKVKGSRVELNLADSQPGYGTVRRGGYRSRLAETAESRESIRTVCKNLQLNSSESKFMEHMAKREDKLQFFIKSGVDVVQESKVSKAVSRNKFCNDAASKEIINENVKNRMDFKKDVQALNLLKDSMEVKINRDIKTLHSKQGNLVEEYNRVADNIRKLKIVKDNMQGTKNSLQKMVNQIVKDHEINAEELRVETQRLDEEHNQSLENKNRMDRIIDICRVNLIQNEEWMRVLSP